MRIFWLIFGLASLALGGLGVALPLLPTTPFVLLAAYCFASCFARFSPVLHDWLLRNPTFGKAIRNWRADRAISRRGKTASVLAMVLSLALSLILAATPISAASVQRRSKAPRRVAGFCLPIRGQSI